MARSVNLVRRGARWHFRIPVPRDLRDLLGKGEIRRSLGLVDGQAARRLALIATTRSHAFFEKLRAMARPIDPETLKYLVREYYDQLLVADFTRRTDPDRMAAENPDPDDRFSKRPRELRIRQSDFWDGHLEWIEPLARQMIDYYGLDLGHHFEDAQGNLNEGYADLTVGLAAAQIEALKRMVERDDRIAESQPELELLLGPSPEPPDEVLNDPDGPLGLATGRSMTELLEKTGYDDPLNTKAASWEGFPGPQNPGEGGVQPTAAPRPARQTNHSGSKEAAPKVLPEDEEIPLGSTGNHLHDTLLETLYGVKLPDKAPPKGSRAQVVAKEATPPDGAPAALEQAGFNMPREKLRVCRPPELLDRFWRERADNDPRTRDNYVLALGWLDEVAGGKAIADYTDEDIRAYKDCLLEMPKKMSERFKTDSVYEGIRLAKSYEERRRSEARARQAKGEKVTKQDLEYRYERLALRTIREKHLSNVRTFMRWAASEKLVDRNPAEHVQVNAGKKGKSKNKERLPFPPPQLQSIFSLPLFTTCRSSARCFDAGNVRVRDWKFWLPLLALYTGMRSNEIGQLCVNDVCEDNGLWYLWSTTISDSDEEDEEDRRLKTQASHRQIPINSELIRIGFIDYVQDMRRGRKNGRLFPDLKPDSKGYYSGTVSKWFNRSLLKNAGIRSKLLVFHSFRHNYKDLLSNNRIDGDARRVVLGHSSNDAHSDYGAAGLPREDAEIIAGLSYPSLDLSGISYNPPD